MTQTARAQLEHLLTTPTSSTMTNPTAMAALQALRDSGDEQFLFLRTILELLAHPHALGAQDEELLFHCITGTRHVLLTGWTSQYSAAFLQSAREWFMVVGQHLYKTSRVCSLACFTTAVSLWKRGWNHQTEHVAANASTTTTPQEQVLVEQMTRLFAPPVLHSYTNLLDYMENLLQQQQHVEQAATFLSCLVGEFSGKSAVSYRLPLEFHKAVHTSFEKQGALYRILQLSMQALSRLVASTTDPPQASLAVVQLVLDVLNWEFGLSAWSTSSTTSARAARINHDLWRPPVEWKEYLVRPDLAQAIFVWHCTVVQQQPQLAHSLRQLLLVLVSLSGPIFAQPIERQTYAVCMAQGTLELLQRASKNAQDDDPCLLDALQLVSRLVANFRLSTLVSLPCLVPLLQGLTATGNQLLLDQVHDCEQVGGDLDAMEYREWREEALMLVLEAAVLLCGDPWLLYSGTDESRKSAQQQLSTVLGPLYEGCVRSRTRMAALEEHYHARHEADLDDVQEAIVESNLEEELGSVATIGRLNLSAAIACLSAQFSSTMPQLQALWQGSGQVTPETAALLEQARLLNLYVSYLLTDDNEGEAPSIPDAVVISCRDNPKLVAEISSAVQAVVKFADAQVHKIAENPSNLRLSPLLACSFLSFLNRWAPAYIFPTDSGALKGPNPILKEWSTPDKAQQVVSFCVSLCLYYQSYWPLERQVQQNAGKLLMSLARRGPQVRMLLVASPAFHQLVQFHCLTAGIRHGASKTEFEAQVRSKGGDAIVPSIQMIWGYQRLPYDDKSRILTTILVACSDTTNEAANKMINESLKAIHDAFASLKQALSSGRISFDDVNAKEMACLCVEMLGGVARASEMADPERIPQLLTEYLPQLSGLMEHYAQDLTICEALLRFFRDYTESFIATLDRDQSLALFNATAELLKSYSAHHCASRSITKRSTTEAEAEEEQAYSDILCVLQLLINLGTKDFIDACNSGQGVDSAQVTDVIFFGLQQILPLMTQGLLQFPRLCSVFFDLIGFMNDTYPDKVCVLPLDLFTNLLESLLFGMSHHDANVAKNSLYGLASIAREHLSSQILKPHLEAHPDIFDRCSTRLLTEVVFQPVVFDREEAAAMALLPLAAVDVNRFAQVVQQVQSQVPDPIQRARLQAAFQNLIQPECLAKVSAAGYQGRINRAEFKKRFEEFVNEVHSFLVLR